MAQFLIIRLEIKWTIIDTSNSEETSSINYVMHKLYELKNVTFEKSLANKEKHSINNNILLLFYSQARVCHQLFWFRLSSKNTCEPKISCSSVYLINNSLANGDSSFPVCLANRLSSLSGRIKQEMLAQICYLIFQRKAFILRNYEVAGLIYSALQFVYWCYWCTRQEWTRNLCYHLSLSETLVTCSPRGLYKGLKVLPRMRRVCKYYLTHCWHFTSAFYMT